MDGDTLLLIGGYEDTDGGITLDDTYLYDLNSQEWTQLVIVIFCRNNKTQKK